MTLYLLRYGEIGTKSQRIRQNFIAILMQNIERAFLKDNREIIMERSRGRIYAYVDDAGAHLFARIFGLVSYSKVTETSAETQDILEECGRYWKDKAGTFAIRARRTGKHPYTSQEIAAEAGGAVLEANPGLTVDLSEPDHVLHVEVRNNKAYLFSEIRPGPGGLPLGSQGKVVSYVEDREDFLATWLMMRRGARAYVVHPEDDSWVKELETWDPNLKILGKGTLEDMLSMDLPGDAQGMILGETLEDMSNTEHRLPIYRPLVGFTEKRVIKLMERIDGLKGKSN